MDAVQFVAPEQTKPSFSIHTATKVRTRRIFAVPWHACHVLHAPDQVIALRQFDCTRANKSTASWGVEARVPFLDVDFIAAPTMASPEDKMIDLARESSPHRF